MAQQRAELVVPLAGCARWPDELAIQTIAESIGVPQVLCLAASQRARALSIVWKLAALEIKANDLAGKIWALHNRQIESSNNQDTSNERGSEIAATSYSSSGLLTSTM